MEKERGRYMSAENVVAIHSITEAKLVARKADGIIPIAPCVQADPDGQVKICPNLDRILVCTDPDGLIPEGTGLQCPKQRGLLTLIASGEN